MRLTVATANVDSPEWAELLIKSVRLFTEPGMYEIIVIDNGSLERNLTWLRAQGDIRLVENGENVGHGKAMDQAVRLARGDYMAFLDIDSHVQRQGWDAALITLYRQDAKTRLVGCVGPDHKPLHPPLFFFEPKWIAENGIAFEYKPQEPRSTDTAQKAYWDILERGYGVMRLEKGPKIYDETRHDEVWIGGEPAIAHMWYGVRFRENTDSPKAELDGYRLVDHLEHKARFFAQPLVREILGHDG